MSRRLYVFGTGHAMVTRLYNSCFGLEENGAFFFLDAGGGNGILQAVAAMEVSPAQVRHLFITHTHTDHILGGIWVVRAVGHAILEGGYTGSFTIWGHRELIDAFRQICGAVLAPNILALLDARILLRPVEDGECCPTQLGEVTFFDTGCTQVRQFGCVIRGGDGIRLGYLGDEPIHPRTAQYISGCDWLLADALCLEAERHLHHPERSFHSSVAETCRMAQTLRVKHLVLCHTEESHGPLRRERYLREGRAYFSGSLFVPDDREILLLQ